MGYVGDSVLQSVTFFEINKSDVSEYLYLFSNLHTLPDLSKRSCEDNMQNIVQHNCGTHYNDGCGEASIFDDGKWVYCWQMDKKCSGCEAAVSPVMLGFVSLVEWERD